MKLSRTAIALYVGLVFVSGATLGVFGDRTYSASVSKAKDPKAPKTPEQVRHSIIDFWKSHLKLSDDQVIKVGLIMDETRARMDELHRSTVPAQQEIRREQMDKMRAILTPDQQMEYDRLQKAREDRLKKGGSRGGPGGF